MLPRWLEPTDLILVNRSLAVFELDDAIERSERLSQFEIALSLGTEGDKGDDDKAATGWPQRLTTVSDDRAIEATLLIVLDAEAAEF